MNVTNGSWTIQQLAKAGLFAALTAVGAWIAIPMPSGVPFTLQVLVSLLSGIVLGSRAGALSQLIYVVLGAVGLPVFASRVGGFQELIGPTGGYLFGFVIAAWIVGKLTEKQKRITLGRGIVAMLGGLLAIYLPGSIVLSFHLDSFKTAVIYGVVAYLPVDLTKAAIALAIARGLEVRGISRAADVPRG